MKGKTMGRHKRCFWTLSGQERPKTMAKPIIFDVEAPISGPGAPRGGRGDSPRPAASGSWRPRRRPPHRCPSWRVESRAPGPGIGLEMPRNASKTEVFVGFSLVFIGFRGVYGGSWTCRATPPSQHSVSSASTPSVAQNLACHRVFPAFSTQKCHETPWLPSISSCFLMSQGSYGSREIASTCLEHLVPIENPAAISDSVS